MAHTFTHLLTHLIFSTKGRLPLLDPALKERLFPYMGGIIRNLKGTALLINGPTGHVHILASLSPTLALSDLLRDLKADATGWVHDHFPQHRAFAWQVGYAAFSVSKSGAAEVRAYIAGQEEHHRTITFQEELLAFLKRHEIAYDPRFI